MKQKIEHLTVQAAGVDLHVAAAGPEDGEPLIFLHGFPEFWYAWQGQLDYFAQAGYRVYAPDQRGFGESDKPSGIAAYHIDKLADDVIALMESFGHKQFNLVGHDWGGVVAWHLLSWHAERLRRVVVLNAPHLSIWRAAMLRTPVQMLKSWYVFAFQIPAVPERLTGLGSGKPILALSGLGTVLDAKDRRLYRKAYSGALGTMMNWYRAAMRYAGDAGREPSSKIEIPLLLLWGRNDRFLSEQLARDCMPLCTNGQLQFVDNASHWLVHEKPEEVNTAISSFLSGQ